MTDLGPSAAAMLSRAASSRWACGRAKYVEIVDRFPLTGSGKAQKFKPKACAVEKCALRGP